MDGVIPLVSLSTEVNVQHHPSTFFCHPIKCYHLPLMHEQMESIFMIQIKVLLRYYRDRISLEKRLI